MYSSDASNNDIYISSNLYGLEKNEVLILKKSIPPGFDLIKTIERGEISFLIEKKQKIIAYKINKENRSYFSFRISEEKYSGFLRDGSFKTLAYPSPDTARLSSTFTPVRKNPVSGKKRPHLGVDYSMPMNTKIVNVINGVVSKAEWNNSRGYYVEITGQGGIKTRYLHLNKILVKEGQNLIDTQDIALSGNSGRSSGPHLHYELLINNKPVDSLSFGANKSLLDGLGGKNLEQEKKHEEYLD